MEASNLLWYLKGDFSVKPPLSTLVCNWKQLVLARPNFTSFGFLLAALCVVQPLSAQVTYRVTELIPASGYTQSEAMGINDAGIVVGVSYPPTINWNGMATRWTAGKPTALGIAKGGTFSMANSVNKNGVVVGEGDDGRPNAVVFNSKGSTFLTNGANNSYAMLISDTGVIYGNLLKGFDGKWTPVAWKADPKKADRYVTTEFRFVDSAGLASECFMLGVNQKGQAFGYGWDSLVGQVPLYWNSAGTNGVVLPGPAGVLPLGINDNGLIVGIFSQDTATLPKTWSAATGMAIAELPLPTGETFGYATGVNNLGMIIGSHSDQPAVWINGACIDVNSHLDASSASWKITSLQDINNTGLIVGTAVKNNQKRAVVLTPTP